jgi:hypothetical protein
MGVTMTADADELAELERLLETDMLKDGPLLPFSVPSIEHVPPKQGIQLPKPKQGIHLSPQHGIQSGPEQGKQRVQRQVPVPEKHCGPTQVPLPPVGGSGQPIPTQPSPGGVHLVPQQGTQLGPEQRKQYVQRHFLVFGSKQRGPTQVPLPPCGGGDGQPSPTQPCAVGVNLGGGLVVTCAGLLARAGLLSELSFDGFPFD